MGSEFIGNCTNQSLDTTTHVFTTTPIPPESPSMSTVAFTSTMAMSLAAFDSAKRDAYQTGVAQALSVPIGSVAIGLVTETVSRRRLLSTTIEVETIATVPTEDTESVTGSVTAENINGALADAGMSVDDITPPEVQGLVATTPVTIDGRHEWTPLGC